MSNKRLSTLTNTFTHAIKTANKAAADALTNMLTPEKNKKSKLNLPDFLSIS
jgi:hypothetical protein